jgi:hypothetical protein
LEREGISIDAELKKSATLQEPIVENNLRIKVRHLAEPSWLRLCGLRLSAAWWLLLRACALCFGGREGRGRGEGGRRWLGGTAAMRVTDS